MAGRYIHMLKVSPSNDGFIKVINQEYDYGILGTMLNGRPTMIPLTPRLGVFTLPRNRVGRPIGILTAPMLHLPRRIPIFKMAIVIAFYRGLAVSTTPEDIAKFKMLYKVAEEEPRKLRLLS